MTSPARNADGSPSPRPRLAQVAAVVVALLAGIITMVGAIVLIVVIRPLGWRLAATLALWIPGIAALILFSDGLDRLLPGNRRRRWAAEALHWLSASLVALAVAVVLGAFLPSLLSLSFSPSWSAALGCDALIGVVAGLLTLGVTAFSGWAGGELSYKLLQMRWAGGGNPQRIRFSARKQWSLLEGLRLIVLPVAGILLSAGATQLFATVPPKTASPAADTTPTLPSPWSSIVLPITFWFLGTGLVWFAFDWFGKRKRPSLPEPRKDRPETRPSLPRRRASHANALAVVLAILIGWASALVLDHVIQSSLSTRGTPTPVLIRSVPPAQRPAYLAQKFVPQFDLARGEQWEPTTVNWYVAHSDQTKSATFCVPGPNTEPQGCRELCKADRGPKCAHACDDPDPDTCAPIGGNPHAVYYRYLQPTNPQNDPRLRAGHDWAVIEYWIFYNYDSLSAGLITQWHQSDWEQVSVLAERKGSRMNPVEVGFSEHCYGAAVPAAEVSWNGSHPVSFVGLGSHANYPTANDLPVRELQCLTRETRRYLGAAGLFFNPIVSGWSLELPVAYLIGLRDQTGRSRTVADAQPISQQATPSIWSFHGYWGVDNNLRILAGRVATGAGPQSPQDQGPSLHPFKNMFCSPKWIKLSPTRATAWVCSP